jgi:hypothetical protein
MENSLKILKLLMENILVYFFAIWMTNTLLFSTCFLN